MPVAFTCPNPACARTSRLPDEAVGRRVKCPACGQPFTAPPAATIAPKTTDDGTPRRATAVPAAPVEKVGRFVVRGKLGEGAFGAVYRAYDPQLDREVALKVPHAAVLDSPKRVERFLREAKAAANLRHPHVVPVFDAGSDGGRHYIASAFIDGQKLADAVEASDGGLDVGRAARLVRELAEALAYAHEQGIVHRDVKPDNVMLDRTDRVHLMDFGLASRQDVEARLTSDGAVMGTPSYMAPEQARGDTAAVGPAADQYACGVVLYELLTGKPPFSGPIPVVLHHQIHTDPDTPSKHRRAIPKDLEQVCLMALNKRPEERYASCRELAEDLRRWQEGEPVSVRPLNTVEKATRWVRKEPKLAVSLAAVLVVLLAGSTAVAVFAQRAWAAQAEAQQFQQRAQGAEDQTLGLLGTAEEERQKAIEFKQQAEQATKDLEEAKQRSEAEGQAAAEAKLDIDRLRREADDAKQRAERLNKEADKAKQEVEKAKQEADALRKYGHVPALAIKDKDSPVYSTRFSPDGRRLLTVTKHYTRLWDADSGKELFTVKRDWDARLARFSRDSRYVALADDGGALLQVRDTGNGEVVCAVGKKNTDTVRYVQFSPDGRQLVTETRRLIQVWDVSSGKELFLIGEVMPADAGSGDRRAWYSPDGRRLVTEWRGYMRVWAADTGKEALAIKITGEMLSSVTFSPDGRRLAVGFEDGTVRVWDAKTCTESFKLGSKTEQMNRAWFSPDGLRILTIGKDDQMRVWDADSGNEVVAFSKQKVLASTWATFCPRGRRLVTSDPSSTLVWDIDAGKVVWTIDVANRKRDYPPPSFSPDGRRLATTGDDGVCRVWDTDTWKEVLTTKVRRDLVYPAFFCPTSRRFVAVAEDGTANVWDAKTGTENLAIKQLDVRGALSVQLSWDHRRLINIGADGTVRMWLLDANEPEKK